MHLLSVASVGLRSANGRKGGGGGRKEEERTVVVASGGTWPTLTSGEENTSALSASGCCDETGESGDGEDY